MNSQLFLILIIILVLLMIHRSSNNIPRLQEPFTDMAAMAAMGALGTIDPTLAPAQPLPAQPLGQRVAVPADANGRVWGYGPRNSRTGCPVGNPSFRCRADGVWLEPIFDREWIWYFDPETNRYFHRNEITATGTRAPPPI
jgi:hypothetical protein